MCVVYFDQCLGAAHSRGLVKIWFFTFFTYRYRASTRLRLQNFDFRLENEHRVQTPIRRYLLEKLEKEKRANGRTDKINTGRSSICLQWSKYTTDLMDNLTIGSKKRKKNWDQMTKT